jgi:hypothetical protein
MEENCGHFTCFDNSDLSVTYASVHHSCHTIKFCFIHPFVFEEWWQKEVRVEFVAILLCYAGAFCSSFHSVYDCLAIILERYEFKVIDVVEREIMPYMHNPCCFSKF